MDFLDSIDLKRPDKKFERVRSWYLYEQYKSLKEDEFNATEKLEDKSYQEWILQQEMSDRRARRNYFDQSELNQSEQTTEPKSEADISIFNPDTDILYKSVSEIIDNFVQTGEQDFFNYEDHASEDDSKNFKIFSEIPSENSINMKEEKNKDNIVYSITNNFDYANNISDEVKEELETAKKNIVENIKLQMENVRENIQYLEEYAKISDESVSEEDSVILIEENSLICNYPLGESLRGRDNNVFEIWSKLVSFAYQVTQSSYCNCYYDSSSQLMTVVLVCDVLRKGICRMCDILQPYVSPIKFSTNEPNTSTVCNEHRKRSSTEKESKPNTKHKPKYRYRSETIHRRFDRMYHSENCVHNTKYSLQNLGHKSKKARSSEPFNNIPRKLSRRAIKNCCKLRDANVWTGEIRDDCRCVHCACRIVKNPMLSLVQYMEGVLDESKNV